MLSDIRWFVLLTTSIIIDLNVQRSNATKMVCCWLPAVTAAVKLGACQTETYRMQLSTQKDLRYPGGYMAHVLQWCITLAFVR